MDIPSTKRMRVVAFISDLFLLVAEKLPLAWMSHSELPPSPVELAVVSA